MELGTVEVTAANIPSNTGVVCSFCNRDTAVVDKVVSGLNGNHICNFCIKSITLQIREQPCKAM